MAIIVRTSQKSSGLRFDQSQVRYALGIKENASPDSLLSALPFSLGDTTVGCENEFQTVVYGEKDSVDLPLTIRASNYYQNILNRSMSGETPSKIPEALDSHINANASRIWENSWVRFPRAYLSRYADEIFKHDLLADKNQIQGPLRSDADRFVFTQNTEEYVRIPISYLLKLAIADTISASGVPPMIRRTGNRFMRHFLNDNTSPETYSFFPVPLASPREKDNGVARETLLRFLLCQSLIEYANIKFKLKASGQEALLYFAPHPPIRQKSLNNLISDEYYRELFMSPCLSGWDCGEKKHQYIHLCHQVMSRSQLNAVIKLKDAGIIYNNLIVLPNTSNISLANNGTHLTLGSRKLTKLLAHSHPDFTGEDEKHLADLTIKIVEHFLPLFVGTYSAAPYRLDFWEFHPEKALGFLPHELNFTHLRMIWRRWKKKARMKILGRPITPFGPECLDRAMARLFHLRGDFVYDFRLIDYLMCLMSTDQSPALDGTRGNDRKILKDLESLGVFDANMPPYLLYRSRLFDQLGFCGFEGRHYSLFESIENDLTEAANLQNLVTALAYKYILSQTVAHGDIPDIPTLESERRQIFFGRAIGLPTFFIRKDTRNRFLLKIIPKARRTRMSRRYSGYIRVYPVP